jgi:hypothetical protein
LAHPRQAELHRDAGYLVRSILVAGLLESLAALIGPQLDPLPDKLGAALGCAEQARNVASHEVGIAGVVEQWHLVVVGAIPQATLDRVEHVERVLLIFGLVLRLVPRPVPLVLASEHDGDSRRLWPSALTDGNRRS